MVCFFFLIVNESYNINIFWSIGLSQLVFPTYTNGLKVQIETKSQSYFLLINSKIVKLCKLAILVIFCQLTNWKERGGKESHEIWAKG